MIGKTLNHYRILEQLGRGGMGEVYLAEDTRLDRRVALKILPASVAGDPDRLARFTREAKAIAALNHPNIVTIHSVEEAGDLRFLVMEHIEGRSLDKAIPKGGMQLGQLLDVAIPLADALAAAHDKGIAHRDLKPANVMITGEGRVKMLDFGLAKLVHEAAAGSDTQAPTEEVTQKGLVMGTLPYMSPEQVEGKSVDHRSDIFSLGAVLHEMASGSRPFKGDSTAALVSSILRDQPPPLFEAREEIPADLVRVVARCLMKDPTARLQTARDVCNELKIVKQQIDSGQSFLTSSGVIARAGAGRKPKRALWAGGAAAIIIVAVAGSWLALSGRAPEKEAPSETAPDQAPPAAKRKMLVVLPFENLGGKEDDYFASGVAEEITSRLSAIGGLGVISRKSAMSYAGTEKTTQQIGSELGVDYIVEGTIRWAGSGAGASRVKITPSLIRVADDTQVWSDTYDRVVQDIFDVQSEIATHVTEALGLKLLDRDRAALGQRPTDSVEAYQSYLRGKQYQQRYDMQSLSLAVELLQRAVDLDPKFVDAYAFLSRAHAVIMHFGYDTSPERDRKALEAAQNALALDPGSASGHVAMGFYHYHGHKDYAAAMKEFDEAGRIRPDDPDVLFGSALVLRRQGRWEESTSRIEKAHVLDPRNDQILADLGDNLTEMGRYGEALRALEMAKEINPDAPGTYFYMAFAHWTGTGDLGAARRVLESVPPGDRGTLDWIWTLQLIYEHDYEGARRYIDGAGTAWFVQGSQEFPKEFLQGWVRELQGEEAGAREHYEKARALMEPEVATGSFRGKRFRSTLGVVYAGLGRREDALREGRISAEEEYALSRDAVWSDYNLRDYAWIQAKVGDFDGAFESLDKLVKVPQTAVTAATVRFDPVWGPLKKDPRWAAFVEKLSRK